MSQEILKTLQGKETVVMTRPLSEAKNMEAQLVPWQTGADFDPSADSDSTKTKDGSVASQSSVETGFSFNFINNNHFISDRILTALFNSEKMEFWLLSKDRVKVSEDGKEEYVFAKYMQGTISEDSNSNDPDDNSTREISTSIDGIPKIGWVKLSDTQREAFDYIFRGIDKIASDDDKAGGIDYDSKVDGAGIPESTPPEGGTQKLDTKKVK
ncbi:phage tail protein [Companilactobacillus sp. RD055328]|uniref:phage tail tube protein n=1 Tax=Companilactobacillus sp. RD055328 TaxID=2916634 RepID=UPI001FC8B080|nr:phage tail tube protein [Companilactobacillus sp. RD055328]GKQ42912.1 phage tail protein [Companilactobacillus sp. RD055328]